MKSETEKVFSSVTVKISCDRTQIFICVSGNVSAKEALNIINDRFPDIDNKFFLRPDITAVPDGYSISVSGRQSLKEYLAEKQFVRCVEIFSVCEMVINILEKYGQNIFFDTLFDYSAVFVANNMETLNFIFVPFLHHDKSHINFKEFIRILFIHMSEKDADAENSVIRLIDLINEWELSGYNNETYTKFALYVKTYFENYDKTAGKDFLSRGTNIIKQIVGNLCFARRDINDNVVYISFLCGKSKKQSLYAYDKIKKVFWRPNQTKNIEHSVFSRVKIGRDKEWADWHIPDMTISGKFGEIYCCENRFFIHNVKELCDDGMGVSEFGSDIELKDGHTVSIGGIGYRIKIL